MTDANSVIGEQALYTAFGERVSGSATRFGYIGAYGYQSANSDTPGDPYVSGMPYQHVGARYYDRTTGRFLQRDPIGIRGGLSVYAYVGSKPTDRIDAQGLMPMDSPAGGSWDRYNNAVQDAIKPSKPKVSYSIEDMKAELREHEKIVLACKIGILGAITGPIGFLIGGPVGAAIGGALAGVGGVIVAG